MKKIFFNVLYLVLNVLIFTYLVISRDLFSSDYVSSIANQLSYTGIPVIAIIFIITSFVFAILSLCMNRKTVEFCKEMFCCFGGAFGLATGVLGFVLSFPLLYVNIILSACSLALFVIATINLYKMFKSNGASENQ